MKTTERMLNIDDSIFTYSFALKPNKIFSTHFEFNNYFISAPSSTNVLISGDRTIAIVGLCVDSKAKISRSDIPSFLSSKKSTITELLSNCNRLAGTYVILAYIDNTVIALNDAAGYMQINYCKDNVCFASNEKIVGDLLSLNISEKSSLIRKGSNPSQAFPNDLTMYAEVKALLPNHYLDLDKKSAVRFFPKSEMKRENNVNKVVDLTMNRVSNIIKEYSKTYDLICPLTGGTDSRLNLAFLKKHNNQISTYTFYHKEFNEMTSDVYIPKQISSDLGIKHAFLDDLEAPAEFEEFINKYCGDWHSEYTIDLAYTLTKYLKNNTAIVNGDIIDQVGKSLIGNSVPDVFATPSFFQCKIHNYSKQSKIELQKWAGSIENEMKNNISPFDLFAWENRLGRWASQGNMLYSCLSIPSLNIYNCRDIINSWFTISRKKRKNLQIHLSIFDKLASELLQYPFNSSHKITNFMKSNWVTFLIGTYGKYWYEYFRKK